MTRLSGERPAVGDFFSGISTLPALLVKRATTTPSALAYFTKGEDDRWQTRTWAEYHDDVGKLASEFARHGISLGTRVGILAGTSLDWETAQMALLWRGAVVAGIDPYYPDEIINRLVQDLQLRALIVGDRGTLSRLSASNASRLDFVFCLRGAGRPEVRSASLRETRDAANASSDQPLASAQSAAVIAFSSGSTGNPKPVLYTHEQVVHACRCILDLYPEVSERSRLVCWLPLANLFQRMINFCAIAKGAASYVVEDPRRVMDVVPVANPEIFVAVPRFCERLHAGIMDRLRERPILARMVNAAVRLQVRTGSADKPAIRGRARRIAAWIADRVLLARVRALMGNKLKFIVSGSAPMPRWLLDRFFALGMPVLEAYGTSENLVPVTANRLAHCRAGTVGKPVGDNDVRLGNDGEVQVRGRGVFLATLGDNAKRRDALTEDGYLATGDIGYFDSEGFLTLRGRRTEAFKNSQGRWVSLSEIEAALRQLPRVEHAVVIRMAGDRLVALLALQQHAETSSSGSIDVAAVERLMAPILRKGLKGILATLPPAERPISFLVVCNGFSPQTGELTTNLKIRRAAIEQKFCAPLGAIVQDAANLPRAEPEQPVLLKFV